MHSSCYKKYVYNFNKRVVITDLLSHKNEIRKIFMQLAENREKLKSNNLSDTVGGGGTK